MNVIDWIRESSLYMYNTRPDVYPNYHEAMDDLTCRMEYLREVHAGEPVSALMSAGFILLRLEEDEGQEEFQLAYFVSSATTFLPENTCLVLGNPSLDIDLPSPSDVRLDNDDD